MWWSTHHIFQIMLSQAKMSKVCEFRSYAVLILCYIQFNFAMVYFIVQDIIKRYNSPPPAAEPVPPGKGWAVTSTQTNDGGNKGERRYWSYLIDVKIVLIDPSGSYFPVNVLWWLKCLKHITTRNSQHGDDSVNIQCDTDRFHLISVPKALVFSVLLCGYV